jgi:hypothetical protein
MEKGIAEDLIQDLVQQRIRFLFKQFLEEMEIVQFDHNQMMAKIIDKTSIDYVKDIDSLSPEKFHSVRKKILDNGNDCLREILSLMKCFDWTLNEEKFAQILSNRKFIQKIIFSPSVFIYEK